MILKKIINKRVKYRYSIEIDYLKEPNNLEYEIMYHIYIGYSETLDYLREKGYKTEIDDNKLKEKMYMETKMAFKYNHHIELEKMIWYFKEIKVELKGKCDICGERKNLIEIGDGRYSVCRDCLEEECERCNYCYEYFPKDVISNFDNFYGLMRIDEDGDEFICGACIQDEDNEVVICDDDECNHNVVYRTNAINLGDENDPRYYCNSCKEKRYSYMDEYY